MIYHFYRNPARYWLVERAGGVAIERGPGVLVNLGFKGGFQGLVRIVRAEEVGVAGEEAFLIGVGVDEPAGDAVGARPVHACMKNRVGESNTSRMRRS